MGNSADAYLAYGFDLGGGDNEWQVEEADQYGEWRPTWLADDDYRESVERALLADVGFTETDWQVDGYYARRGEALARVGVELKPHCSGDYPVWMLVTHLVTAYWGDAKAINFTDLERLRTEGEWDAKLRRACEVLGITSKQPEPGWFLASYWG
jgi:hypothetical protein